MSSGPPAASPGLLTGTDPGARTAGDRAARVRFRRAVALMLMTLFLPGSAQLVAGNRRLGRVAMRIWMVLVAATLAAVALGLVWSGFAFWLVSDPFVLGVLRVVLMVLAVGWAGLVMDAWRIGQPLTLSAQHRRAVVGVNGLLSLSVAGALLFSAHLVGVQRDFMITMFGDGHVTAAHDGRYNVLLLGGDSGAGRWGLRPDSLTIASIDEDTGRTVLISLPRNMARFPFAEGSVMRNQFPNGFNCEGCYLNGVSTWAGDHTNLFKGSENPGVDATIMAVEGITGLEVNYWAMVNLQGFKDLVDAVGGVTLNVRAPIPVGGLGSDVTGYIQPGTRRLDGHDTLWFARAREGSDDYSRMARQKCVMSAMLQQISPQAVLRNFQGIAKASSEMLSTNIPSSEVDRFIDLALEAKGQKVASLSLVPPMINTGNPDIGLIREKVADAIDKAEGQAPPPSRQARKKPQAVTGGSLGSLSEGYVANQSDDLGSAC
jgi:polyisoprenyl-teichoic acid--peptidoglycan teichoic acid transferase